MKKTTIVQLVLSCIVALFFVLAIAYENESYKDMKPRYIPQLDITCKSAIECVKGKHVK